MELGGLGYLTNITLYLVPFLSYLTLNNTVTLKSGLEVTQVIQTGTTRKLGCGFLFAFDSNYGSILHHSRDWKSWFFHTPLHSTPPLEGLRRSIAIPFGAEKLEWCGYPMVKKISKIRLFVLPWSTNVTDEQTDRHRITAYTALCISITR